MQIQLWKLIPLPIFKLTKARQLTSILAQLSLIHCNNVKKFSKTIWKTGQEEYCQFHQATTMTVTFLFQVLMGIIVSFFCDIFVNPCIFFFSNNWGILFWFQDVIFMRTWKMRHFKWCVHIIKYVALWLYDNFPISQTYYIEDLKQYIPWHTNKSCNAWRLGCTFVAYVKDGKGQHCFNEAKIYFCQIWVCRFDHICGCKSIIV
jgi:hypothetical protein